jgi:uncharacterized membrane protein
MRLSSIAYFTTLVAMAILDSAWISFALNRLYKPGFGSLMGDKPVVSAAIAFYLLYPAGVTFLITSPLLANGTLAGVLLRGAVFGLVAYGTYDLTNQAIMRGWPWNVTLADMAWGAVLTAVSAGAGYLVASRFK